MKVVKMNDIKYFKVVAVAGLFFALCCLPFIAKIAMANKSKIPSPAVSPSEQETATVTTPDKHLFSQDDFVLMFSGDWEGRLEPCGCAAGMLGGIKRRNEILKDVGAARRLLVDIGAFVHSYDAQKDVKFQIYLTVLQQLGYDVMAVSQNELIKFEELGITSDMHPTLVCANMSEMLQDTVTAETVFKKTLQAGKNKHAVMVISLASFDDEGDGSLTSKTEIAAIKEVLDQNGLSPTKGSNASSVIVLLPDSLYLQGETNEVIDQLRDIAAIDLIVCKSPGDEPELVHAYESDDHKAAVITVGRLGKYVATVSLSPDNGYDMGKMAFKYYPIDDTLPEDKEMAALFDDYVSWIDDLNLIDDIESMPRIPLAEGLSFVGADKCVGCHEPKIKAHETWKNSRHGHAFSILKEKKRMLDPECVACHTTGSKYDTGYRTEDAFKHLENNGCEMCHGPASKHIANPGDLEVRKQMMIPFMRCSSCHDTENSPKFSQDFKAYFDKIKHWDTVDIDKWK